MNENATLRSNKFSRNRQKQLYYSFNVGIHDRRNKCRNKCRHKYTNAEINVEINAEINTAITTEINAEINTAITTEMTYLLGLQPSLLSRLIGKKGEVVTPFVLHDFLSCLTSYPVSIYNMVQPARWAQL